MTEESVLSETFWNVTLPQNLETSVASRTAFHVFVAQVNKAVSDDSPNVYFKRVLKQCETKKISYIEVH